MLQVVGSAPEDLRLVRKSAEDTGSQNRHALVMLTVVPHLFLFTMSQL